jgi:succinyl-diaminopimelate desuccinylase
MDPISLTKKLVSINSSNPFKTIFKDGREIGIGNEAQINNYLEQILIEIGFKVERQIVQKEEFVSIDGLEVHVPERWNLLASKGTSDKSILFLAHTDTVDVKSGWPCNAFSGEEKIVNGENRFYALGSNDMKSGIAAILCAAKDVEVKDFNIKIAFVCDEEFWSIGADFLVRDKFLNDVKLCLVPELMEYALEDPRTQWFGLGRLGRAEYLFEVTGSACHGADAFVSKNAINAVHESIKLQNALLEFIAQSKNVFKNGEIEVTNACYISKQEGGKGILSVPDKASFIIDRSLIPSESVQGEFDKLNSFLLSLREQGLINPATKVELSLRARPTPPCEPYFISENSELVKFLSEQVLKVEKDIKFGIGRSVADENRLANLGIPVYILPPRGGDSHTNQEWVDFDSVERLTQIFKLIVTSESLKSLI